MEQRCTQSSQLTCFTLQDSLWSAWINTYKIVVLLAGMGRASHCAYFSGTKWALYLPKLWLYRPKLGCNLRVSCQKLLGSGERKPTQGLGPRQRNHGHHQYGSSRGLVFLNHQGCPGVAHFHIILHESLLYLLRQDSLPWGKTFKAIEAG